MSTKNQTNSTQTAQYDPSSMATYQSLQPGIQKNVANDMQLDPTKSSTFNLGMQNALNSNALLKMRAGSNLTNNMAASGFAGNSNAFQQAQLNRMGRAGSSMDAQSTNQNFLNYDMLRRQSTGQAMSYRPLQTGQTGQSTQTTSGLGTWLPQVVGAGLQIGGAFATGGASLAAGAAMKAGSGMGTGAGSAMANGSYFNDANPFTASASPFSSYNAAPAGVGQFGSTNSPYNPFNSYGGR